MPLANPRRGGARTVEVVKTEEKGSDVNLATFLLLEAFKRDCDVAVVISNDSDLKLPIEVAQTELGLRVGVLNPQPPARRSRAYTPSPCDPNPRFIAPFEPDSANPAHWVAGGEFVWDNQGKGWNTTCGAASCDWKQVYDTGAGRSITAIGVNGATYVGWCGPCNRAGFTRGIATNYGGSWHALSLPASFPNRFIQAITVDSANPAHAYVVFNGFSRRWTNTFSAGEGHVWETTNGGSSWRDISGNLPDAPGDDIVLTKSGKLVEASDIGVFVASAGQGAATTWSRFGILPHASVNDLQLSPNGSYLIAATHGRGLWKTATP